jgi:hypothetical protein
MRTRTPLPAPVVAGPHGAFHPPPPGKEFGVYNPPEHDEALRLAHALQDSAVLRLRLQHWLQAHQDLLDSLQELRLLGVTAGHLGKDILRQQQQQ